jgi:protease II
MGKKWHIAGKMLKKKKRYTKLLELSRRYILILKE